MNSKKLGLLATTKKILILLILYGLDLIIRWKSSNDSFSVSLTAYGELLGKVHIFLFLISSTLVFSAKMVFCTPPELGAVSPHYKSSDAVVDLCVTVSIQLQMLAVT